MLVGAVGVKAEGMVYRVILIVLIRAYQRLISPFIPASCRFYPSCSEYAIQAVGHYGLLWGTAKAAWRLLRCNPLCRGGVDLPIPTGGDPV